ncbi:TRAP transporter permease [Amorphus sp. 3PC139-8]|uniref:TRAP transporter permease n=1 Tax=Amorphus sp. 3PC139-8 TaxID=2735676 RepID=UPI00345D6592
MSRVTSGLLNLYFAFLLIGGIAWAMDVPLKLGLNLVDSEWLGPYLGVAVAAGFLLKPYRKEAGLLEIVLGLVAIATWTWMSYNFEAWLFDFMGHTPQKYVPGIFAVVLMMEALRKICGTGIAALVWVLIAYAFVGWVLPQPFQADRLPPESVVMYLYADTSGIPGLVLSIVASLVLAFIVLGKLMEVGGATTFFTDLAMSMMGHRRGGPAKVAVIASSLFGSVSGSPVGNIMSTGVVTIPLMKRTGFTAAQAAAIEAVASTGGQIAPPVMGAAAFLMAEFLQIDYYLVVFAALLPAIFYYICLFVQVDAVAERRGLVGLPRADLPRIGAVFRSGWVFVLPLGLLLYLLFWANKPPAEAALTSAFTLLVLAIVKGRFRSLAEWRSFVLGGGEAMIPIVLIAGGAGAVVGVMNVSGLGQSLSFIIMQVGHSWGLLAMLVLTAILSIILGMGMPVTAIYIVLATVIAPSLIDMGLTPLAAHLFIFYFGVMSFLTPPVCVSSFVAASLARAGMWETGWIGMRFSAIAFILPFVWAYDPALLLDGTPQAIVTVVLTTLAAILVIGRSARLLERPNPASITLAALVTALVVAIASAPVWAGPESILALVAAAVGYAVYALLPRITLPGLREAAGPEHAGEPGVAPATETPPHS